MKTHTEYLVLLPRLDIKKGFKDELPARAYAAKLRKLWPSLKIFLEVTTVSVTIEPID